MAIHSQQVSDKLCFKDTSYNNYPQSAGIRQVVFQRYILQWLSTVSRYQTSCVSKIHLTMTIHSQQVSDKLCFKDTSYNDYPQSAGIRQVVFQRYILQWLSTVSRYQTSCVSKIHLTMTIHSQQVSDKLCFKDTSYNGYPQSAGIRQVVFQRYILQ